MATRTEIQDMLGTSPLGAITIVDQIVPFRFLGNTVAALYICITAAGYEPDRCQYFVSSRCLVIPLEKVGGVL